MTVQCVTTSIMMVHVTDEHYSDDLAENRLHTYVGIASNASNKPPHSLFLRHDYLTLLGVNSSRDEHRVAPGRVGPSDIVLQLISHSQALLRS